MFHSCRSALIILGMMVIGIAVSPLAAAPHIAVDLDSGKVLSRQQEFDPWHPASLTKLMTAYSVFKAIRSGEINGNHVVRISKNARKQPPSRMAYRPGTTMTLDNALKLLVVKSANDIAVAIAESVSGSVEGFSNRMNRDAAALGMTGSKFTNPHGLHDRRQVTTAHDLALLAAAIHRDFPQYRELFSNPSVLAPSKTKNGKTIQRIYYSYNLLLERFRGADGFKTGFVCASGYNFIGAATRSGRRIAAVVLGRDSQTSRAVDAAKLIEEGFRQPSDHGLPLAILKPEGPVPTGPRNMRNQICTEQARATRYEPGAGQAVIKSPWLQDRVVNSSPLTVALGTTGGSTLPVSRIPLPSFRPAGASTTLQSAPVDDVSERETPVAAKTETIPSQSAQLTSGPRIPLPTFRPGTL